jgi:hypothetical protein
MKTVLSVLCWIGIAVMISGCDNGDDSGGTATGSGNYPDVSFAIDETTGTVTCYNADSNVTTSTQVCTWNCAYYGGGGPRYVRLTFDDALVCEEEASSGTSESADYSNSYSNSITQSDNDEETLSSDYESESTADFEGGSESETSTTCTEQFALADEHFGSCVL